MQIRQKLHSCTVPELVLSTAHEVGEEAVETAGLRILTQACLACLTAMCFPPVQCALPSSSAVRTALASSSAGSATSSWTVSTGVMRSTAVEVGRGQCCQRGQMPTPGFEPRLSVEFFLWQKGVNSPSLLTMFVSCLFVQEIPCHRLWSSPKLSAALFPHLKGFRLHLQPAALSQPWLSLPFCRGALQPFHLPL